MITKHKDGEWRKEKVKATQEKNGMSEEGQNNTNTKQNSRVDGPSLLRRATEMLTVVLGFLF